MEVESQNQNQKANRESRNRVDDSQIIWSGWLFKQGGIVKTLRRRFFILHKSGLLYYSNTRPVPSQAPEVLQLSPIVRVNACHTQTKGETKEALNECQSKHIRVAHTMSDVCTQDIDEDKPARRATICEDPTNEGFFQRASRLLSSAALHTRHYTPPDIHFSMVRHINLHEASEIRQGSLPNSVEIVQAQRLWILVADSLSDQQKLLSVLLNTKPKVLCDGWMWKRGFYNTAWKLRYFQLLSNGQLHYFVSDSPEHLQNTRGCLMLSGSSGARFLTIRKSRDPNTIQDFRTAMLLAGITPDAQTLAKRQLEQLCSAVESNDEKQSETRNPDDPVWLDNPIHTQSSFRSKASTNEYAIETNSTDTKLYTLQIQTSSRIFVVCPAPEELGDLPTLRTFVENRPISMGSYSRCLQLRQKIVPLLNNMATQATKAAVGVFDEDDIPWQSSDNSDLNGSIDDLTNLGLDLHQKPKEMRSTMTFSSDVRPVFQNRMKKLHELAAVKIQRQNEIMSAAALALRSGKVVAKALWVHSVSECGSEIHPSWNDIIVRLLWQHEWDECGLTQQCLASFAEPLTAQCFQSNYLSKLNTIKNSKESRNYAISDVHQKSKEAAVLTLGTQTDQGLSFWLWKSKKQSFRVVALRRDTNVMIRRANLHSRENTLVLIDESEKLGVFHERINSQSSEEKSEESSVEYILEISAAASSPVESSSSDAIPKLLLYIPGLSDHFPTIWTVCLGLRLLAHRTIQLPISNSPLSSSNQKYEDK